MPQKQFADLMRLSVAASQCPEFVLELGRRQKMRPLFGVLGFVMRQCATIGEAFRAAEDYFFLQAPGTEFKVHAQGNRGSIVVRSAPFAQDVIEQYFFAALLNPMRRLCGRTWRPLLVRFSGPKPAADAQQRFREIFRAPIEYNSRSSGCYFDAELLDRPIYRSDPNLKRVLEKHLQSLSKDHTGDTRSIIRQLIKSGLPRGEFSAERIADRLGIHRRTLHRSLSDCHCTYTILLEEVRDEAARHSLLKKNTNIAHIAETLGYSDSSAFSRAFKREHGVTPRQWRSAHSS